jgi:hypothetical protein
LGMESPALTPTELIWTPTEIATELDAEEHTPTIEDSIPEAQPSTIPISSNLQAQTKRSEASELAFQFSPLESESQEVRRLLHIEDRCEAEQVCEPSKKTTAVRLCQPAHSVSHSAAVSSHTPLNATATWSVTTASGLDRCRMDGLSPCIWGAAASFAMRNSGLQHSIIYNMLDSLDRDIKMIAMQALTAARAAGIILQHPCFGEGSLAHAKRVINTKLALAPMRQFYIGITGDPPRRFAEHRFEKGCVQMDLYIFNDSLQSGNCEVSLLRSIRSASSSNAIGCLNNSSGGESRSPARPHFCYIAWRA